MALRESVEKQNTDIKHTVVEFNCERHDRLNKRVFGRSRAIIMQTRERNLIVWINGKTRTNVLDLVQHRMWGNGCCVKFPTFVFPKPPAMLKGFGGAIVTIQLQRQIKPTHFK